MSVGFLLQNYFCFYHDPVFSNTTLKNKKYGKILAHTTVQYYELPWLIWSTYNSFPNYLKKIRWEIVHELELKKKWVFGLGG